MLLLYFAVSPLPPVHCRFTSGKCIVRQKPFLKNGLKLAFWSISVERIRIPLRKSDMVHPIAYERLLFCSQILWPNSAKMFIASRLFPVCLQKMKLESAIA